MRLLIWALIFVMLYVIVGCEDDEPNFVKSKEPDTLIFVASPAADTEAECIAVTLSRTLLAPQWLYNRIHADLSNIRSKFKDSVPGVLVTYWPYQAPGAFGLSVDTTVIDLSDSTSRHLLDSAGRVFDLEFTRDWVDSTKIMVWARKRYYTYVLMKQLIGIPGIRSMSNDFMHGDGPDVCVARNGLTFKYFFMEADGDCDAGCISRRYSYFVSDSGTIRHVETTPVKTPGIAWTDTVWMDTMRVAACQKWTTGVWEKDAGWTETPDDMIASCLYPPAFPVTRR